MESVAEAVPVPNLPLLIAVVLVKTALVETANDVLVAPPGTVTEAGTVAATFDELNVTTAPSAPAFYDSFTVPTEAAPPATIEGASEILDTA